MNQTNFSRCLLIESAAISNAAKNISNDSVEKVLDALSRCYSSRSKIIFSGVGKSGIVARKIAATFTSIGLVSIYLNPLDALHGDLGVVSEKDVVMFLSNSGETEELIQLGSFLKDRSCYLISFLGNIKSSIAKLSNIVIDSSVDREVCPLNLAPTASTTVSMAIGDALAAVWMERNKISKEEFAFNHPSGSLGKKLTLKVNDIMTPIDKSNLVFKDTLFFDIVTEITKNTNGLVCVVNKNNLSHLEGIITDGDLRRSLKNKKPELLSELNASSIMTFNPITINQNNLAADALSLMEKNSKKSINVLPVLDSDKNLKGIINLHTLVKLGLE